MRLYSLLVIVLLIAVACSGCANLTEGQRHAVYAAGGLLVVGAIAAHNVDHGGGVDPMNKHAGSPSCQSQKGC